MSRPHKITPFLWFDGNAEDAINFYVSVFDNSSIISMTRWGDGGPGPEGSVMSATFELDGQRFMALNGGPQFKFTEAISFFVECGTQSEVDHLWDNLSDGGEEQMCGWLKDKFGVSWQIIPSTLEKLMHDEDSKKSNRVMEAMLQMRKIDIASLQRAYDNG